MSKTGDCLIKHAPQFTTGMTTNSITYVQRIVLLFHGIGGERKGVSAQKALQWVRQTGSMFYTLQQDEIERIKKCFSGKT